MATRWTRFGHKLGKTLTRLAPHGHSLAKASVMSLALYWLPASPWQHWYQATPACWCVLTALHFVGAWLRSNEIKHGVEHE